MVGQFNEQVAAYASDELRRWRLKPEECRIIAVGERVTMQLAALRTALVETAFVPSSVSGITPLVHNLLVQIKSGAHERG
jgi:F0F1-type ATP synthase gamma subunit